MGNCLKYNNSDDISLLRSTDGNAVQDLTIQQQQLPTNIYDASIQPVFYATSTDRIRPGFGFGIGASSMATTTPVTGTSSSQQQYDIDLEEKQIKIAKRLGLIQHLPIGKYDASNNKKTRECVICMIEFSLNEAVRYLPCMHIYHVNCIDDWLMRSLTCPSCLEPVDAALLTSYETT